MSDRTGAAMMGRVFEALAEHYETYETAGEPDDIAVASAIRDLAESIWDELILHDIEHDFNESDLNVDEALLALGLARYEPAATADPDGFADDLYEADEQILCYRAHE